MTNLQTTLKNQSGLLLVVTGAGISVASGIPTFRGTDEGAIWKNDVLEKGTFAYFRDHTLDSWSWYLSRFQELLKVQPNEAHLALAALEQWQTARGEDFLLVTQNIDTLHEQGGSKNLIKVHGSSDRVRCPVQGCENGAPRGSLPRPTEQLEQFVVDQRLENLPQCPIHNTVLRPHVLWFDEFYTEHADYQWSRTQSAASNASLILFIGTSFSVGVTDFIVNAGLSRKTPMVSIDPGAAEPPYPGLTVLSEPAELFLPEVIRGLTGDQPQP